MPSHGYTVPSPTASAHFMGYSSPLAIAVKHALENLNIYVTHTQSQDDQPTYCFYFLPQALSTPETSAKIQNNLELTLENLSKDVKFCLIMRHPDEYYFTHHPSLFPHFSTQENQVLSHQNHLLSCVDSVRKYPTSNSRLIIVKDCVGENLDQDAPLLVEAPFIFLPTLVKFLNQPPIVSPVSYNDAAKTIIKTVFSQHSRHQIYTISGSQPIPVNIISQQIAQSSQNTASPVIISLQTKKFHIPSTQIFIKTTTPLSEVIATTALATARQNETKSAKPSIMTTPKDSLPTPFPSPKMIKKSGNSQSTPQPTKASQKNKPPVLTNYFQTAIIFAVISCILVLIVSSPLAYVYIAKKAYQAISKDNSNQASQLAKIAQSIFPVARGISILYVPLIHLTIGELDASQVSALLTKTNNLLTRVNTLPEIIEAGNLLVAKMVAGEKGDTNGPLNTINTYAQTAYEDISAFEAFLSGIDQSRMKSGGQKSLQTAIEQIQQGRVDVKNVAAFLSISSRFSGGSGAKTYLLLLQNNHELRATGGFIGSFALVTFDQGKLIDIETHDVYAADGQLRGHVEPPSALKKHLGEANWYLRDSNWDPNFPTSARRAEWFLSKEMNRQVDGTIAIDLYTVQSLLNVIGEIQLPDYDETINADNLFARAEYHSEINFFSGSTQKKDFLSALMNAIYVKIAHPKEQQGIGILRVLLESAKQAHLQISVRDESLESVLEDTLFSGKVIDPACPQVDPDQCLVDYIGVVDSNVGVNKVNYFINRQIDHQIAINQNQVDAVTLVTWDNTAQSSAWPAGSYKNYVRLVVPQYASVVSLNIGNKPVPAKDLDIEVRHEKKYIGTYVEVPIASQQTLTLTTQYTVNPDLQNGYYLTAYIEKQAGTNQDPIHVSIKNLSDFKLFKNNLSLVENQFDSKSALTTDQSYNLELRP